MTAHAFDSVAHGRAMRAGGFWQDRTIDEYLTQAVATVPDKLALVGYRADRPGDVSRFTYRELGDMVERAAGALRRLGVGRGDIVAVQLPNWWEFVVTSLACGRIGAVVNPLMPIFRERELSYMLDFAEVKVLVVPKLFRGFDHEAMAGGVGKVDAGFADLDGERRHHHEDDLFNQRRRQRHERRGRSHGAPPRSRRSHRRGLRR